MRPLPVYRPKAKAAGAPIRVRRPPVLFRPLHSILFLLKSF